MATKKVTITISEDALEKIEVLAKSLDLTPNTLIKQIAMNHINNSKLVFFSSEQRLALQNFNNKQSQLITTLRKIDEEYLKQGKQFPTDKILEYFKSYNTIFKATIERLSDDN